MQFRWNPGLLQCQKIMHRILDPHGIILCHDQERWWRGGRDFNFGCDLIRFLFDNEVTRVDLDHEIRTATFFICIVDCGIGALRSAGAQRRREVATGRDAEHTDSV